jgi:ComF family protein
MQAVKVFVLNVVREISSGVLSVLAPLHCLLCKSSLEQTSRKSTIKSRFVCQACFDALPPAPPDDELLAELARHFPHDTLALSRMTARFQWQESLHLDDGIVSIEPLLYALKYGNMPSIGRELGRELGELMRFRGMTDFDALVPVPLHAARVRERGYNQSEEIAKGLASVLNIPVKSGCLKRLRYTQSQTLLSADERKINLANVFSALHAKEQVQGKVILLTDDVITTGSTLNACADALLQAGAKRVEAATLIKA